MYTFDNLLDLLRIPNDNKSYRETALKSTKSLKDIVTNSKTISGSFNELDEKDQQKVVDSFNKINGLFNDFFGIETEPYKKEDFAGAEVRVTTTGDDSEDAHKNEGSDSKCKNCTKDCESAECGADARDREKKDDAAASVKTAEKDDTAGRQQTLCESLFDELMRETMTIDDAADMIVEKVVSILKDKKNKRYTLLAGDKDSFPVALIHLALCDFFTTEDEMSYYTKGGELRQIVEKKLKKATGAKEVYVLPEDVYGWVVKIRIR